MDIRSVAFQGAEDVHRAVGPGLVVVEALHREGSVPQYDTEKRKIGSPTRTEKKVLEESARDVIGSFVNVVFRNSFHGCPRV